MDLLYKKAVKEDAVLINQLADRIWRKYYTAIITMEQIDYMLKRMYSVESLVKQMEEGQQFTLVYHQEKPVGYISISTMDSKKYFLHKFYVETEDHRKGIGSDLFNYILKQLKNAEIIELTVNRQNYKAINFYFKNGFTIKEVADFDIGEGYFMNDFVMVKNCK